MWGAIEAGGTKFYCAVGTGPDDVEVSEAIATTTPAETLAGVFEFFGRHPKVKRLGLGAFGPVEIATGTILRTTPKKEWRGCRLAQRVEQALGVPVLTDTDVNVAALGEYQWGAAQAADPFLYLTIGTGVGGGGLVNGRLLHGALHPEMGHLHVPRERRDRFPGVCPAHGGACLEGLISGPALNERERRGEDATAWAIHYLAWGLLNLTYAYSPRLVVLGGGVMKRPGILRGVRTRLRELNQGYAPLPQLVRPALGDRAGVLGALALAAGATLPSPD